MCYKMQVKRTTRLTDMKIRYLLASLAMTSVTLFGGCSESDQVVADKPADLNGTEIPLSVDKLKFPMSDLKLIYAQKFEVEEPFVHDWQSEPARFHKGVLVVLEADQNYIHPRNSLEPVLYAGTTTVQKLNRAHLSGRVIGIIPGDVFLEDLPIWFGEPALPEQLTADDIEKQFNAARDAGITALPKAAIVAVTDEFVRSENLSAYLREHGADVVLRYAPQEESLAKSWRLPIVGTDLQ